MTGPDVAFAVAGGPEAGSGHAKRCARLAGECVKRGCQVSFFIPDVTLVTELDSERAVDVHELPTDERDQITRLAEVDPDVVVADVLQRDISYFEKLESVANTVQIEDRSGEFVSTTVVSGYCQNEEDYHCLRDETRLLLGTKYLVLPTFLESIPRQNQGSSVSDLLVTFGSVDRSNKTAGVAQILGEYADVTTHLIVPHYRSEGELDLPETIQTYPYGDAYQDLVEQVDVAITSGGNTAYEMAALGVPNAVIAERAKQARNAQRMEAHGLTLNWGCYNSLTAADIETRLETLLYDTEKREQLRETCLETIDFDGCRRIVDQIVQVDDQTS